MLAASSSYSLATSNGVVELIDYQTHGDCITGPGISATPAVSEYADACCRAYDANDDVDV